MKNRALIAALFLLPYVLPGQDGRGTPSIQNAPSNNYGTIWETATNSWRAKQIDSTIVPTTGLSLANISGGGYATGRVLTIQSDGSVKPNTVAVVSASNGTSLNGTSVELGNATGGTSATLTGNREIPMGGNAIAFTGTGANGGIVVNTVASQAFRGHITSFAGSGASAKPAIAAYADGSHAIYAQSYQGYAALSAYQDASNTVSGILLETYSTTANNSGVQVRQFSDNQVAYQASRFGTRTGLTGFYADYEGMANCTPFHGITGTGLAYKYWKFGGTDGGENEIGEMRCGPLGFNTNSANGTVAKQTFVIDINGAGTETAAFGARVDDNTASAEKGSALIYSLSNAGTLSTIHAEFFGTSTLPASSGEKLAKFTGNIQASGKIIDSSGDAGTSGQILTSTATGTNYVSTSELFSSLSTITAATSDLANTAYGGAAGDLFWWKPTGSAGLVLMKKE